MKAKYLLKDRTHIIEALSQMLDTTAVYCGAPSFKYVIGDYTILRDGSVEADVFDPDIMDNLIGRGLIAGKRKASAPGKFKISFPLGAFTGRALVNLLYLFAVKGDLLNRAIQVPGAFSVSDKLIQSLRAARPYTIKDVMEVIYACGGPAETITGLELTSDSVVFTGFPACEPEVWDAYEVLADHIIRSIVPINYTRSKSVPIVNEKYSFKTWLFAMGMKSDDYRETRRILMQHLSGNAGYRTQEQYLVEMEKRRRGKGHKFIAL